MRKLKIVPKFGDRSFEAIENLVDGKFSENFKEIMQIYGASSVYENYFVDKNDVDWTLGSFDNFTSVYKLTKEFKENGWGLKVPFAYDQGGWHICLSFDFDTYGKIIVNRWTDHSPEDQFVVIAESFEEFINGLKKNPKTEV